jgi:hypothetical protein
MQLYLSTSDTDVAPYDLGSIRCFIHPKHCT